MIVWLLILSSFELYVKFIVYIFKMLKNIDIDYMLKILFNILY